MAGLLLYCDEDSLHRAVVAALRRAGWDVLTVAEAAMKSRDDAEQLAFAASLNRVVYTGNVGDFARLHGEYMASGQTHAGIIARTRQQMSIGEQVRALLAIAETYDAATMAGRFVYLEEFAT